MFPKTFVRQPGRYRLRYGRATAVACFLFYTAPLLAQAGPGDPMQAAVLSEMHMINQLEIEAGGVAKLQGGTSQVRDYGDRLARDHIKADAMVQSFAQSHGMDLMSPIPPDQQQALEGAKLTMQKLKGTKGIQFDEGFLQLMKGGHLAAVTTLGNAHQKLAGTELGKLIGELLPILEQHYEIAATLDIRLLSQGSPVQTAYKGGE